MQKKQILINGLPVDNISKVIYDLIRSGRREKPVSTEHLMKVTNLSRRALRQKITNLIFNNNVPIGTSRRRGGYFIIRDDEDLRETVMPLQSQINEELRRINRIKDNYKGDE